MVSHVFFLFFNDGGAEGSFTKHSMMLTSNLLKKSITDSVQRPLLAREGNSLSQVSLIVSLAPNLKNMQYKWHTRWFHTMKPTCRLWSNHV